MPKVAIIVPGFVNGGGVPTLAKFLYSALTKVEGFSVDLISLVVSSSDPLSVSLLSPLRWRQGVQVSTKQSEGLTVTQIGAFLSELEFQRYQPRKALTALLAQYDILQVVCGSPAFAHVASTVSVPTFIYFATTFHKERRSLLRQASFLKSARLRIMTRIASHYETLALKQAYHVFALSDYTADLVRHLIPQQKLSVAFHGVDTNFYTPPDLYADNGYILAVGRFSDPRKNVRLLFEAYHKIQQSTESCPKLVIAGARPSAENWSFAQSLGIDKTIEIREGISDEALALTYQQASMFILTSDEEGLGIVILEAMASGLPVISTKCGGPESIIVENKTGFLVQKSDSEAIKDKALFLIEQPTEAYSMGQAGCKHVEQNLSRELMIKKFVNIYQDAISRH